MRFCGDCWAALKQKVSAAGLDLFISNGGAEAGKRMAEGSFDPLLGAYMAIIGNALDAAPALAQDNADGTERCPVCYLIDKCPCTSASCSFRTWMDRAVEDELTEAKRRGLVASA